MDATTHSTVAVTAPTETQRSLGDVAVRGHPVEHGEGGHHGDDQAEPAHDLDRDLDRRRQPERLDHRREHGDQRDRDDDEDDGAEGHSQRQALAPTKPRSSSSS